MAVEMINNDKDIKFDCVDTWLGSPEHQILAEVRNDTLFNIFTENIKPVAHKINAIRSASVEACSLYEDKSLDFAINKRRLRSMVSKNERWRNDCWA